jgi:hypothetical protein
MEKKINLWVIPTDKPSRLYTYKGVLNFTADEFVAPAIVKNDLINLNIYITFNEEIKDDWCYDEYNKVVFKNTGAGTPGASKKIILTTDPSLDGVQAIDDDFLEWFVKNPSCEKIEIKTRYLHSYKTGETFISFSKTPEFSSRNMQCIKIEPRYEIIIPQEEPKQENCCTPASQIKRYVDCVGCDRKPKQMSKQSVVEWFSANVWKLTTKLMSKEITKGRYAVLYFELHEQAIKMEEEQIIDAASDHCYPTRELARIDAEQYYKETYKNK